MDHGISRNEYIDHYCVLTITPNPPSRSVIRRPNNADLPEALESNHTFEGFRSQNMNG